jgi:hypothetical protein
MISDLGTLDLAQVDFVFADLNVNGGKEREQIAGRVQDLLILIGAGPGQFLLEAGLPSLGGNVMGVEGVQGAVAATGQSTPNCLTQSGVGISDCGGRRIRDSRDPASGERRHD